MDIRSEISVAGFLPDKMRRTAVFFGKIFRMGATRKFMGAFEREVP